MDIRLDRHRLNAIGRKFALSDPQDSSKIVPFGLGFFSTMSLNSSFKSTAKDFSALSPRAKDKYSSTNFSILDTSSCRGVVALRGNAES